MTLILPALRDRLRPLRGVTLLVLLLIPAAGNAAWNGLPLDRPQEALALLFILPPVVAPRLWGHLGFDRAWWVLAALVLVLRLAGGAFDDRHGFAGCYAPAAAPPTACETTYAGPAARGATRLDRRLDFGPRASSPSELIAGVNQGLVDSGPLSQSNWDLQWANDLRFNLLRMEGEPSRDRLPFSVVWSGTASVPEGRFVRATWTGEGVLEIADARLALKRSYARPRTATIPVVAGEDLELRLEYRFDDGSRLGVRDSHPYAELRLETVGAGDGSEPQLLEAASSPTVLAALALAGDAGTLLLLLTAVAALAIALRADCRVLLGAGVLAVALLALPQADWFPREYRAVALCALATVLALRRSTGRPVLLGYLLVSLVAALRVLMDGPRLEAVLYRAGGTDWLTYETFARDLLTVGSLQGGEDVFYYQPGFRYLLWLQHTVLGDGDVLRGIATLLALSLASVVFAAAGRERVRGAAAKASLALACLLMCGILTSETLKGLSLLGATETPTWVLLPLIGAVLVARPDARAPWVWAGAAAAIMVVMRPNQLLGLALLTVVLIAALGRHRRRDASLMVAAIVAVSLLPAAHNLFYGGKLAFLPTSGDVAVNNPVRPAELPKLFSNAEIRDRVDYQVDAILYRPEPPLTRSTGLLFVLWASLALWLASGLALLVGVVRAPAWVVGTMLLPLLYLGPHVLYNVVTYYPRHIMIGYVAMAVIAALVVTTGRSGPVRGRRHEVTA